MVKKQPNFQYRLAVFISLITLAVYLPSLQNEFVAWDDSAYVYLNSHIRTFNAVFFKWIFFDFYAGNWHPLTWISHALDYAIWGLNPMGHHLTNIILHSVNTFLVVLLITELLKLGKEIPGKIGLSEFLNERTIVVIGSVVGLLFGLHPLHVESVAWVAERKDLLCALFFLLAILTYIKYITSASNEATNVKPLSQFFRKNYLLSLAFFILALLSKPMAVTLPLVLLMLDWHPFKRISSYKTLLSALIEKLPFIVLSFISSILTILAQKTAMVSTESLPISIRYLVAADSLIRYLCKMIWPLNLVPFYPYPKNVSIVSFRYLVSIELLIWITLACIVLVIVKKQKVWLVAWSYYIVTLLPVIGIVQVGGQALADRYTYLPCLGPFFIVGLITAWISANTRTVKIWSLKVQPLIGAVAIVILTSITYLTVQQIDIWRNGILLWDYVIEHGGDKVPLAYINRGASFYKVGRLDRAIDDYNKAIALKPSYFKGYFNRGEVYEKKNMFAKALADFNKAIELNPDFYYAYCQRGMIYEEMDRKDKAIENYNKAISLDSSAEEAYFNLGVLYERAGLFDRALEHLNNVIALNPKNADYFNNRGAVYSDIGQTGRALIDLNKAIELAPTTASAYYNRGVVFNQTGKRDLAISDLRKACELGDNDGCNGLHLLTKSANR